jgi:hypothetical protein
VADGEAAAASVVDVVVGAGLVGGAFCHLSLSLGRECQAWGARCWNDQGRLPHAWHC